MRTLIVYTTRHGTTESIAHYLADWLTGDVDLLNLNDRSTHCVLAPYETVIIGSSIHIGRIPARLSAFITRHLDDLLRKRVGLYLCCMNASSARTQFEEVFPLELRRHAIACATVGGEFLIERMTIADRLIVRTVSGVKESISRIDYDTVNCFARSISNRDEDAAEASTGDSPLP